MFTGFLIFLGIVFLISILLYVIPQLLISFLPPLDLNKRYGKSWAVVTGGSSGIGRAFALKLAKQNFNVVILGTNSEKLSSTESAVKQINSFVEVRQINTDISSFDGANVAQSILSHLEGLDISIVFFNAGFMLLESLAHPSPKSLKEFHTNIVTHQHLFHALYPRIASRPASTASGKRGAVLFTASMTGFVPLPFSTVYNATKAYLGQFGECLAVEAANVGIDVVSLYPGPTQTPGFESSSGGRSGSQSADACAGHALSAVGRFVRADSGVVSCLWRLFMRVFDTNVPLWGMIRSGVGVKMEETMVKKDL